MYYLRKGGGWGSWSVDQTRHHRHMQQILDAMNEAVVATDAAGHLTFLNHAAMRLLGCHGATMLGRPWKSLFRLVDENSGMLLEDPFRSCVVSGSAFSNGSGCILRIASGRELFVEANTVPLFDGEGEERVIGAVMTIRDLTDISDLLATVFREGPHDALTALLDEESFERRLRGAMLNLRKGREHALVEIAIAPATGHDGRPQNWWGMEEAIFRQVATLLATRVRARDALCARGRRRFRLLLENCDCREGQRIARALRKRLVEWEFFIQGQHFGIEAHAGVVVLNRPYVALEELLETLRRTSDMAATSSEGVILLVPSERESEPPGQGQ